MGEVTADAERNRKQMKEEEEVEEVEEVCRLGPGSVCVCGSGVVGVSR